MKCIFCLTDSSSSSSIEHIIPESLGNKRHILPKGVVCDKCNNYFAVKIENPVLNNEYFISLRQRNVIFTKRNKLPSARAIVAHPQGATVEIMPSSGNILSVIVPKSTTFDLIQNGLVSSFYIPIVLLPKADDYLISRFLFKVAFEAFAERIMKVENWNEELVEKSEFDQIRDYVRFGKGKLWPYHLRRVYNEDDVFTDLKNKSKPITYQVLHEYDFLVIDESHLYFVCIILGVEYAVNLFDRTVEEYKAWLQLNDNRSPLARDYQIIQDI